MDERIRKFLVVAVVLARRAWRQVCRPYEWVADTHYRWVNRRYIGPLIQKAYETYAHLLDTSNLKSARIIAREYVHLHHIELITQNPAVMEVRDSLLDYLRELVPDVQKRGDLLIAARFEADQVRQRLFAQQRWERGRLVVPHVIRFDISDIPN